MTVSCEGVTNTGIEIVCEMNDNTLVISSFVGDNPEALVEFNIHGVTNPLSLAPSGDFSLTVLDMNDG